MGHSEGFLGTEGGVHLKNGYHGPQFRETHRTKKGGMISPALFNVAVNSVVYNWLSMTVKDEAVIHNKMVYAP